MTYNCESRILQTGVFEKTKLTIKESKILICLSSGKIATHDEISRYVYGLNKSDKYTKNATAVGMAGLRNKTKKELIITAINDIGYKLENEIYFE